MVEPELVDVPRKPALRAVRLAAIAGAVAAGALVVAIALPDGRGVSSAFASWSAAPDVVPASTIDAIDRACREAIAQALADSEVPSHAGMIATLGTPTSSR
jgi:hypothetical protein